MTIRNREITKLVLIKHLHTAELILAADTTSLRTSSTPLTNDHPRFILEPYSRGPQTETRTLTTAPNLNINMRIDLVHGRKRVSLWSKD